MTPAPKLSLIVITKNEEASIGRCLASVDFADEIIVVDSGSTDRTVAIAESLGAKVVATPDWPGFGPQKARALDLARGAWVLSLDADEWIEPQYLAALKAAIADPDPPAAYRTSRRSRFCGTVIRHSGWSPDYVIRLFRRGHARFSDDLVHERLIVEGVVRPTPFKIDHDSITSWDDAEDKIVRYATAGAEQMFARGRRGSQLQAVLHGGAAFLKTFVFRAGFLDGHAGLGVANYNRRYVYEKWRRLSELGRAR
ncbi:glycosyltransferase family 2 protein [Tardiphaga alba]|uniref:Glycosyltransferase family 2 protein n=1 Tax=Tardiphaga alba TaxID=340268 RepID=A0ABX8AA17_9BRAD|nr:glycosyltransferase family 2 protein [Tardiphaga alba]QUS39273.1 glycosyltransferase family 2 protein [Tardiphaga alba]